MEAESSTLNRLCEPRPAADESSALVECPSCNEKLFAYDMPRHCEEEMERLKQRPAPPELPNVEAARQSSESEGRKPWSVFKRVQRNRHTRLRQRSRKYTAPTAATPVAPPKDFPCPLCNARFAQNEIQQHTEKCLRRSNGDAEDPVSSNEDEEGDEYEEYEWAGQKRIRVSSLLRGGYASIGVGQASTNSHNSSGVSNSHQEDDDEDLNVDEDDTEIYGPAQYGERDIIPCNGSPDNESDVTSYMRRLITEGESPSTNGHAGAPTAPNNMQGMGQDNATSCDINELNIPQSGKLAAPVATTMASKQQQDKIIEALKAKLRHYENQVQNKFKCLICLDDYRNPAISVSCWHVHCEECWLRSLGTRKLCPQCNLITTPKDLRRIYM